MWLVSCGEWGNNEASHLINEDTMARTTTIAERQADEMADRGADDSMIIEFSEDISEAEAPDPLPVGDYRAQIRSAAPRVSVNTGNKYAAVGFYISPDEYPADYDANNAPDGKTVLYRRVSLEDNPAARFNMRRFCEAIGAPMSRSVNMADWLNLEARVTIEHDEFEGINRENITRVNPA